MSRVQAVNGEQPAPPQVVSKVEVVMLSDGTVHCKATVPSRQVFIMMMEVAKLDMDRLLLKQQEQKVQLPEGPIPNIRG